MIGEKLDSYHATNYMATTLLEKANLVCAVVRVLKVKVGVVYGTLF